MKTHACSGWRRALLRAAAPFIVLAPLYGACTALASEAGPAAAAQNAAPHIALLLPTQSKIFARHAAAVRDGVFAAAKAAGKPALPLREYPLNGEVADALRAYRAAVGAGARLVIGPLTRDAVTAIAFGEPVPVPTLALNLPDQAGRSPERFYMLGLQVETEGRQVAQLAWRDNRRRALVVSNGSALQRRLQAAFSAEFTRLGGSVLAATATPDPQRLKAALREEPDMALLALDFDEARLARPHLGNLPAYAGASANDGERSPLAAFDLADVVFVDMPWLLEADHPAVMLYPRPAAATPELERLYALGIDAWRVAQLLLDAPRELRLDGVSGDLRLTAQGLIERRLRAARYQDGRLRLIDNPGDEPLR
jgi:outer membrane PBP1 activator LpoA protein